MAHKRSGQVILKGTLMLTTAGIIVKIIGSLNWVILSRVLGGEGMGLYQMAYPLYLLALSVSSAGIPVAVSIITAERVAELDYRGARRIFRVAAWLLAATGALFSLLMYFSAAWLIEERYIRDARAYYSLVALAPAIWLVTLLAAFRGYLQGWQIMTPTALSQVGEQVLRVVTMLAFATFLAPRGVEYAAAGATFGATPGALAGLIVMLFFYWRHRAKLSQEATVCTEKTIPVAGIIRRILALSLPISASGLMLPVVANLDLLIVPRRLEAAGYSVAAATEQFGYLTGMAVPLAGLATVLTGALATSIVPAISDACARRDSDRLRRRTAAAFRLANTVTVPAAAGVYILAEPLTTMLYHAPGAAAAVETLAFSILFLGIHQVSTGILQGMGRTLIPAVNMVIAATIKVGLNWTLTAVPGLGITGAAWATVADTILAALLNMYFIRLYTGFSLDLRALLKSVLSAAAMGTAVYGTHRFLAAAAHSNSLATAAAIVVGIGVYGLFMLTVGGIRATDIKMVPLIGENLLKILVAFRLLKHNSAG
ncbi:putative polysaccharide biosynthesis protein [Anaeroselena agilis]|uniref:Oligosaccharide flippase family protein n=1 Tax=Anaeroselena agilis TaxID=3063788 RepID=A0ABU3NW95_9FIRM|nr:oligosaccharide flippase family protein [Selenomonadales bacterium 4137-cl]